MAEFFPRASIQWAHLDEPHVVRRLTTMVVPMAIAAGLVVRLFRTVWFSALTTSLSTVVVYYVVMVIVACGMLTLHIGNYTVRTWIWRVPAFAAIDAATESMVSLVLIAAGKEAKGASELASLADWPSIATTIVWDRAWLFIPFAVLLGGMVQLVRYLVLKPEQRAAMDVQATAELSVITGEHTPPQIPVHPTPPSAPSV
jgi:hypothetical protein